MQRTANYFQLREPLWPRRSQSIMVLIDPLASQSQDQQHNEPPPNTSRPRVMPNGRRPCVLHKRQRQRCVLDGSLRQCVRFLLCLELRLDARVRQLCLWHD